MKGLFNIFVCDVNQLGNTFQTLRGINMRFGKQNEGENENASYDFHEVCSSSVENFVWKSCDNFVRKKRREILSLSSGEGRFCDNNGQIQIWGLRAYMLLLVHFKRNSPGMVEGVLGRDWSGYFHLQTNAPSLCWKTSKRLREMRRTFRGAPYPNPTLCNNLVPWASPGWLLQTYFAQKPLVVLVGGGHIALLD